MDYSLPDDVRAARDVAMRFMREELLPLERDTIRREAERGMGEAPIIEPSVDRRLQQRARELGLWGIDVPQEYGGLDLGALTKCVVVESLKQSIVPFVLPPESPNLFLLKAKCRGDQIERYLHPYAAGEKKSCLALSEAGAGSDAAGIRMRATRTDKGWRLNGEKIWISNARDSDFMIVVAKSDGVAGSRGGMTSFLVDRDTPGVTIPSSFSMIGEHHPYAVNFENVELSDAQVLGEVGEAFAPLQQRLGVRRLEIAARSLGFARRCIEMMIEQAQLRQTFGAPLSDRQIVQCWIADSFQELEMCRLITYRLAWRIDRGDKDFRRDAAMVKTQTTEMVGRVIDRAMQLFGAMGMSKEMPLEYMARTARIWRIVEGPSEIHRVSIARSLLRDGLPAQ